jgi:hypothetical protein
MNWFLVRLKEPSSWRGIILLLTVCGMKLEPDQQEAIIAAGLAIVGLLGVFTRDKKDEVVKPPIEFQSLRFDRGQSDYRRASGADPGADRASGDHSVDPADRVRNAMQSPLDVKNYRNVDPEPPIKPFGWNDQ